MMAAVLCESTAEIQGKIDVAVSSSSVSYCMLRIQKQDLMSTSSSSSRGRTLRTSRSSIKRMVFSLSEENYDG